MGGDLILDGLPLTMLVDSLVVDGLTVARVDPLERGSAAIEDLIGTRVTVFAHGERFAGRLLATGPGLVLSTVDGLMFLSSYDRIVAPVLVEPPTADQLSLKIRYRDAQPGWTEIGVRYLAEGLSWNVTYTATLADAALQLRGVVAVENRTGVEFRGRRFRSLLVRCTARRRRHPTWGCGPLPFPPGTMPRRRLSTTATPSQSHSTSPPGSRGPRSSPGPCPSPAPTGSPVGPSK